MTKVQAGAYSACSAISFDHSGSLLATGYENGYVRVILRVNSFSRSVLIDTLHQIWDLPTQTLRYEVKGRWDDPRIYAVTFSDSDTVLVSSTRTGASLRAWDVTTGTLLHNPGYDNLWDVVGTPRHPFVIATGYALQKALVYNAKLGKTFDLPKAARAAAFIGDGHAFITGDLRGRLTTWDLSTLLGQGEQNSEHGDSPSDGETSELTGMPLHGPPVRLIRPLCNARY